MPVQARSPLPSEGVLLVPMPKLPSDRRRDRTRKSAESVGDEGGSLSALPPRLLTITFWLDREPELDRAGLHPYLVREALVRVLTELEAELEPAEEEEE